MCWTGHVGPWVNQIRTEQAALGVSMHPKTLLQGLLQQRLPSPLESNWQSCLRDLIPYASVLVCWDANKLFFSFFNKLSVHAYAKPRKSWSLTDFVNAASHFCTVIWLYYIRKYSALLRLYIYYRIIESENFGSEGTPRGHLVQPPCSEQGHH